MWHWPGRAQCQQHETDAAQPDDGGKEVEEFHQGGHGVAFINSKEQAPLRRDIRKMQGIRRVSLSPVGSLRGTGKFSSGTKHPPIGNFYQIMGVSTYN